MPYYRNKQSITPPTIAGYLYYVRLRTAFGPMYKLGFTSLTSLEARFAFKANGDEHLLDRQFLFAFRHDAFSVEQLLHGHFYKKRTFGRYSSNPALPLYQNGQSEIYIEDILQLDPQYSDNQANKTRAKLRAARVRGRSTDPWWWQPMIITIALPFRLVFVSVAFLCRTFERVADMLFKVPPARRGSFFGGAAKQEEAVLKQKRQAELAHLLDWVRAQSGERAFLPAISTISHPEAKSIPEQKAGTSAKMCSGASSSPARSSPSVPTFRVDTPDQVARRKLIDIVQQVSPYRNNAGMRLAHDLRQAIPLTAGDAVMNVAAIYCLVTACAQLYQDQLIDKRAFSEMTDGLEEGSELNGDEWPEAITQFEEVMRNYGISINVDEAEELVRSSSRNVSHDKSDNRSQVVVVEEYAAAGSMRRAQLMLMRMRYKRSKH